jgi:general secretion pathway protein G
MKSVRTRTLGFTMIEIMIVMTIIGMIVAMGGAAYSNAVRQGRDARRKVDLDQIRSALELYRSNDVNGTYPTDNYPATIPSYLEQSKVQSYLNVPVDPGNKKQYFYRAYQSDGTSQCGAVGQYCRDYTLATRLETAKTSSPCYWVAAERCYLPDGVTKANCNYCIGPLGEK